MNNFKVKSATLLQEADPSPAIAGTRFNRVPGKRQAEEVTIQVVTSCIVKPEQITMLPSQILRRRRTEVLEIMGRYPRLSNLRVVGSVARGGDTGNSDIDFLVDAVPGATLFEVGGLHEVLEELLGVPVDIITSGGRMDAPLKTAMEGDTVRV